MWVAMNIYVEETGLKVFTVFDSHSQIKLEFGNVGF